MIKLSYEEGNPRQYTDAFLDYLHEIGYEIPSEIENIFYWLSDDDVEHYARVNFDIEFTNEIDEEDEF